MSWDTLRRLASFRATHGCAISLYVDLDPSVSPTAGEAATRVNALLAERLKSDGASRPEPTHDEREALKRDFRRIEQYFAQEFTRDGAHGLALFCAGLDNVWLPLRLTENVPDHLKVARE